MGGLPLSLIHISGDSDALLKIAVGLMILAEGFVLYFVFFALKRRKNNED